MIKPAGRLVSYVLACALVCCASQALWAQADTVQSLAKRSGDANFASDVIKAAGSAANLAEAIRILESLAPLAKGAGATTVYSQLAVFLEMESRWNEASLAWESSARSSAASSAYSLTQAAVCALYDGDPLRAAKLVDEAKALGTGDAVHLSLISAYASFLSGDRPGALKGALAVVSSGDSRYEPSALVLASAASEGAERDGYLSRLKTRYPRLYENAGLPLALTMHLLAASGISLETATPLSSAPLAQSAALSAQPASVPAPQTAQAAPAPQTLAAGDRTEYFQIGAYRSRQNAQAMMDRLRSKGFVPVLSAKKDQTGEDIFIVYVPAGENGQYTLLKLKDAGFEAWPLAGSP